MDPLSIALSAASVAKVALGISKALYSTIGKTRSVDTTLSAFSREISALGEVLGLIDSGFQDPLLKRVDIQSRGTEDHLSKVLVGLRRILTDCEDTLATLDGIITKSKKGTFNRGILRPLTTAIKLDFKSSEIIFIRSQIHSYGSAMQMALSMLNISLLLRKDQTNDGSEENLDRTLKSLEEDRSRIQRDVLQLGESISDQKDTSNMAKTNRRKYLHLQEYIESAEHVYSSASTYLGSIRGSTTYADSVIGLSAAQTSSIDLWRQSEREEESQDFDAVLRSKRRDLAEKKIREKQYPQAEKLLTKLLAEMQMSEAIPKYELNEVQMLLASTYREQQKFTEAREIFLTQLDSDDVSEMQKLHLQHLLAETYLQSSDAKAGLPYALQVVKSRHRQASGTESYYDSCHLLANIYRNLDEQDEAELYLGLIPPAYRKKNQPSQVDKPLDGVISGALLRTLAGHSQGVWAVAFSPDSRVVASGSSDNTVRLWDAASGALLRTLEGHSSCVSVVAFSPDSRVVASSSYDLTVRLWDAASGALLRTLQGHLGDVSGVAFSPDSRVVASGSEDKTVRLWDAASGALLRTLEGHSSYVNGVAFSPDSRVVASGSNDLTVRLWDAASGALLRTLKGHLGDVFGVAFSPDSRVVASGSSDKMVRLWEM